MITAPGTFDVVTSGCRKSRSKPINSAHSALMYMSSCSPSPKAWISAASEERAMRDNFPLFQEIGAAGLQSLSAHEEKLSPPWPPNSHLSMTFDDISGRFPTAASVQQAKEMSSSRWTPRFLMVMDWKRWAWQSRLSLLVWCNTSFAPLGKAPSARAPAQSPWKIALPFLMMKLETPVHPSPGIGGPGPNSRAMEPATLHFSQDSSQLSSEVGPSSKRSLELSVRFTHRGTPGRHWHARKRTKSSSALAPVPTSSPGTRWGSGHHPSGWAWRVITHALPVSCATKSGPRCFLRRLLVRSNTNRTLLM